MTEAWGGLAKELGWSDNELFDRLIGRDCFPPFFFHSSRELTYIESHLHLQTFERSMIMGKAKESSKEAKKQPAKSPKEKKAAKQAKKQGSTQTPLVGTH